MRLSASIWMMWLMLVTPVAWAGIFFLVVPGRQVADHACDGRAAGRKGPGRGERDRYPGGSGGVVLRKFVFCVLVAVASHGFGEPIGGPDGSITRVWTEPEARAAVDHAYREVLGREPDQGGADIFVSHLVEQGRDESWLMEALRQSPEATRADRHRRARRSSRAALVVLAVGGGLFLGALRWLSRWHRPVPARSVDAFRAARPAHAPDKRAIDYGLYAASWSLFSALLYQVFVSLSVTYAQPNPDLLSFFSSDTLGFAALYEDIFVNGFKWSGWHISNAPQFLGMLLYFLCRFICGAVAPAHLLYAFLLPILFTLAAEFAVTSIRPRLGLARRSLVVLSGALVVLLFARGRAGGLRALFFVCHHGEVAVMLMVCLGFLARALAKPSRIWLVLLAVGTALGALSDPLFLPAFAAPALGTIVILWAIRVLSPPRALGVGVLLGGAVVVGRIASGLLTPRDTSGGFLQLNVAAAPHELLRLWTDLAGGGAEPHPWLLVLAFVLAGLALVATCVLAARRNRDVPFLVCNLFWVLSVSAVTTALVLTGNSREPGYFRYLLPIAVLPFFAVPLLLALLPSSRRLVGRTIVPAGMLCLMVVITVAGWQRFPRGTPPVYRFYPALARELDEHAEAYGLSHGLADYWLSSYATMFSRKGVRLYSVWNDLRPFTQVCNIDWFLGDPDAARYGVPRYNFVVLGGPYPGYGPSEDTVIGALGPPADSFMCDRWKVLVYNRPEDEALRRVFDEHRGTLLPGVASDP